jgi:hypothetical protein
MRKERGENAMVQEYEVMKPFEATAPISGTKRRFSPGEIVVCDVKQSGSTVLFGAEAAGAAFSNYFLADRSVFKACCKWISRGPAG